MQAIQEFLPSVLSENPAFPLSSPRKKPLNSWLAFRSYYAKIFHAVEQKHISGFLTFMWGSDPFKAKWAVLAASYTIFREAMGKDKAPLDGFLAINGPFIGVIHPSQYLNTLGWEIVFDHGQLTIRRSPSFSLASLDRHLSIAFTSVTDVVENSLAYGYCLRNLTQFNILHSSRMMMASTLTSNVAALSSQMVPQSAAGHSDQFNMNERCLLGPLNSPFPTTLTGPIDNQVEPGSLSANISSTTMENSVLKLRDLNFNLEGEFPFNQEFEGDGETILFNPYLGSQFNCYDLGDYSLPSSFEF